MANCGHDFPLFKAGWPGFINQTNRERGRAEKTRLAADGYFAKKRRASGDDGFKVDISKDKPCLRFVGGS